MQIAWLIFDSSTMNSAATFWSQSGLFVYTMVGNLLLYRLCWAMNIFAWSKYEINYISVLQLSNDKPNLLLVANQSATLLLWYFINLMVYCQANMPNSILNGSYLSYGCPFILIVVSVVYQIYESAFMFGNEHVSRGIFGWKTFQNMLFAPFAPLRFRDIYVADTLTSFNRVIADSLYASCWIVSGSFATPYNTSIHSAERVKSTSTSFGTEFLQCTNPQMTSVVSIFQLLPLVTRALQCTRGIYDNLLADPNKRNLCSFFSLAENPQLFNAWKYLLSIIVVLIGLFQASNKSLYYLAICTATLYKWWWDVVMDWGLCASDNLPDTPGEMLDFHSYMHPRKLFLRASLMYPSIAAYYFSIVVDLVLRFFWVLSLLPPGSLGGFSLVGYQLSFFLGAVEIFRRAMWGILRVEYEHLKLLKQHAPGFLNNRVLHHQEAIAKFGYNYSRDSLLFRQSFSDLHAEEIQQNIDQYKRQSMLHNVLQESPQTNTNNIIQQLRSSSKDRSPLTSPRTTRSESNDSAKNIKALFSASTKNSYVLYDAFE